MKNSPGQADDEDYEMITAEDDSSFASLTEQASFLSSKFALEPNEQNARVFVGCLSTMKTPNWSLGSKAISSLAFLKPSSVLGHAVLLLFRHQAPMNFLFPLCEALRNIQRLDVLYFISKRLVPILCFSKKQLEFGKFLAFGLWGSEDATVLLNAGLVSSLEISSLFRKHAWVTTTSNLRVFPWFEGTYSFQNGVELQVVGRDRVLNRSVNLLLGSDLFVGETNENGSESQLIRLVNAEKEVTLMYDKEMIWGNVDKGVGILGKRIHNQAVFFFQSPKLNQTICALSVDTGILTSSMTKLDLQFYPVPCKRSQIILSAGPHVLLSISQDGNLVSNQHQVTSSCFTWNTWNQLSCTFQNGRIHLVINHQEVMSWEEKSVGFNLCLGDSTQGLASFCGAFCDLRIESDIPVLNCPMVFDLHPAQILENLLGNPLILLNDAFRHPAVLPSELFQGDKIISSQVFSSLLFASKLVLLCDGPRTKSTLLHIFTSCVSLIEILLLEGNLLQIFVEGDLVLELSLWKSLDSSTWNISFDNHFLVIDNVCKVRVLLKCPPSFFYASVEGKVNSWNFSTIPSHSDFVDEKVLSCSVPFPPISKSCASCTFLNEPDAQKCALCLHSVFVQSSPRHWDSQWNRFRDIYLNVEKNEPLSSITFATAKNGVAKLEFGPQVVSFKGETVFEDGQNHAVSVVFRDLGWMVNAKEFNFQLDAQGQKVLYSSWACLGDKIPLSRRVRSQVFVSAGLKNMVPGLMNVCYQNSVLQVLFASQEFRQLVEAARTTNKLFLALQELFETMWNSPMAVLDTRALQHCLPQVYTESVQMDAQEFLTEILDTFEGDFFTLNLNQAKTCLHCSHKLNVVQSSNIVSLHLPTSFGPITNVSFRVCMSQQDLMRVPMPSCNQVRLLPSLIQFPLYVLYVERTGEGNPVTSISRLKPNEGDFTLVNCGEHRLYLLRSGASPLTDIWFGQLKEKDVGQSLSVGKHTLCFQSTLPITEVFVGLSNQVPHTMTRVRMGEDGQGNEVYLGYASIWGKPPLTAFSAIQTPEKGILINGTQWTFVQEFATTGCPIVRLQVNSTLPSSEGVVLPCKFPFWTLSSNKLPFKQFMRITREQTSIRIQPITGFLKEFKLEEGIVYWEEDKVPHLLSRLTSSGNHIRGRFTDKHAWVLDNGDIYTRSKIYQIVVSPSKQLQGKMLHLVGCMGAYYIFVRNHPEYEEEPPLFNLRLQTLVANEEFSMDEGYFPVFRFPPDPSGVTVVLCATRAPTTSNPRPLSHVILDRRPGSLCVGEIASKVFLNVAFEPDNPWTGSFLHQGGEILTILLGAQKEEVGFSQELVFSPTVVLEGVSTPTQFWGLLKESHHRRLFCRIHWETTSACRLQSAHFDVQCRLKEHPDIRIDVYRDSLEYWKEGERMFTNCVQNLQTQTLLDRELKDMSVHQALCESCNTVRPHMSSIQSVEKLPNVLILHMNRMQFEEGRTVKNMVMGWVDPQVCVESEEFSLFALVMHVGQHAHSGHYIAYCRDDDEGEWNKFDDALVSRMGSFEKMLQQEKFGETYLLLYRRVSLPKVPLKFWKPSLVEEVTRRYSSSALCVEAWKTFVDLNSKEEEEE